MHRCVPQIAGYRLSRTIGVTPVEKPGAGSGECLGGPSFRGYAKHRARNLEVPRCAIAHLRSGASARSRNDEAPSARMLERKASISERRTSVSRRSALDALSTSPAAVPASAEAMRTNLVGGFRGLAGQVLHLGG